MGLVDISEVYPENAGIYYPEVPQHVRDAVRRAFRDKILQEFAEVELHIGLQRQVSNETVIGELTAQMERARVMLEYLDATDGPE